MNLPLIVFICFASIYFIAYTVLAAKTGAFKKTVAISVGSGLFALAAVGLAAPLTGVWIPFNWWTVGSSAAVGLPGVVALVLSKLIFI